jgi:hypothetical protein
MTKYIVCDNIDFYKEINNISEEANSDTETCLITYEPLEKNSVKLDCGHSFNYEPIYNEIMTQKVNLRNNFLHMKQIKCPFCRNIQGKLLPQIKGFTLVMGVNSPSKYCMHLNTCQYIFKSGKRKGEKCGRGCNEIACKTHINNEAKTSKACEAILKSGKRKGDKCGCAVFNKFDCCKRHFIIENTII